MQKDRVIIVHLRRPRSKTNRPKESRDDPFWEFGSFGITTCHSKNLMHPRNVESLNGVHFAFAQGGKEGTKLVHLTPPVKIIKHTDRMEAVWSPAEMPFRYCDAPMLVSTSSKSDFPLLESTLRAGSCSTLVGQFSSNFRSRTSCLDPALADELMRGYTRLRKLAPRSALAVCYSDALPWLPPRIDREREQTYRQKLSEARGEPLVNSRVDQKRLRSCGPARRCH